MKKCFSYIFLSSFFLFALLNPVFKKYDYGGGWPLILLLAVGLGLMVIFEFKQKRERVHFEKLFLLIFMGLYLTSFIFSQTKNIGLSEVVAYLTAGSIYLLFAYRKIPWMDKFLKVVVYGTVMSAALGLVMYIFQPETRAFGPFFNLFNHANEWPNAYALYLLLTWPIFLLFTGKKKQYFLTSALLGIVLSALFLTYSRGAMISFAGQIILLFAYFVRKIKTKQVLAILLTVVIAGVLVVGLNFAKMQTGSDVENISERATFGNTESLTSKQERIDFWKGALELTKEKPLLGWGPFSFRYVYNGIQKTFLGNSDHPHNIFLKLAVENGLFALAGFLLFLATIAFTVISRFKTISKPKRQAVYVISVGILGSFAHNLIDYNFNFAVNLLLLFLFLAFVRSFFVKRDFKIRKNYIGAVLGILLSILAVYEGSLLAMEHLVYDKSFLNYSLYPRDFYYDVARTDYFGDLGDEYAIQALDKHIELNRLDSRAYYMKGQIYAKKGETKRAQNNYLKALQLNPMNEWNYYAGYLEALLNSGDPNDVEKAKKFIEKTLPLLDTYVPFYVENNVHFTSYTTNVEAAARFIDLASSYIDPSYLTKKDKMLETANKLRDEKTMKGAGASEIFVTF